MTLRNEKYNAIQAKGYSQGKIKALLHNQALKHVLSKIAPEKPEYILIDQFAERGIYYNHIKNTFLRYQTRICLRSLRDSFKNRCL